MLTFVSRRAIYTRWLYARNSVIIIHMEVLDYHIGIDANWEVGMELCIMGCAFNRSVQHSPC